MLNLKNRYMKKIIELPFLITIVFLSLYIVIKDRKNIIIIKEEEKDMDFNKQFFREKLNSYSKNLNKLKPHIIGIFWILILLLIIK